MLRTLLILFLVVACGLLGGAAFVLQQRLVDSRSAAEQAARTAKSAEAQALAVRRRAGEARDALFDARLRIAALSLQQGDHAATSAALSGSHELEPPATGARVLRRDLLAQELNRVWGQPQAVYPLAQGELHALAASPDGRWLAVAGDHGRVGLVGTLSGELRKLLEGHDSGPGRAGRVSAVIFDQDGSLLSAGGDGVVIRWGLPESEITQRLDDEAPLQAMALAGNRLALADLSGRIRILDPTNGRLLDELDDHQRAVVATNGLALSVDGRLLASSSPGSGILIHDLESGKLLRRLGSADDPIRSIAFNADGQLLVSTEASGRLMVWSVTHAVPLRQLQREGTPLRHALFSPDSRRVYSCGDAGDLRIHDLIGGHLLRELSSPNGQPCAQLLLDGDWIRAVVGDTLVTWSRAEPQQWQWELGSPALSGALAPGLGLAYVGLANGEILTLKLPTNDTRGTRPGETLGEPLSTGNDPVTQIALSETGGWLASASEDRLGLWQLGQDGELSLARALPPLGSAIRSLAFAPDGSQLALALEDGRAIRIDPGSGEETRLNAHPGGTSSALFDSSGERLLTAAAETRMLKLWRVQGKDTDLPLALTDLPERPLWAVFRPGGDELAVSGVGGYLALIAPRKKAEPSLRLLPHPAVGNLRRLAFMPGGEVLFALGENGQILALDPDAGQLLFRLQLPTLVQPGSVPAADMDLACDERGCDLLAPLAIGRAALYRFPNASAAITDPTQP